MLYKNKPHIIKSLTTIKCEAQLHSTRPVHFDYIIMNATHSIILCASTFTYISNLHVLLALVLSQEVEVFLHTPPVFHPAN